ncbi:hypothetical protein FRB98_008274 [Tulasnella sp. 332]|nr:hypothetical protein FRB98_008274 [Tulasnella sp. 332]
MADTLHRSNLYTMYASLDQWLEGGNAAPNTTAPRRMAVEIKLLRGIAQYAPVLPNDGTSLRGQAAIVRDIMKCGQNKELLKDPAAVYWDTFLLPSESSGRASGWNAIELDNPEGDQIRTKQLALKFNGGDAA